MTWEGISFVSQLMESSNHSGITYILTFHSVSIPPFNFTKSESSRADGSDWGHSII